jgi:hypothetical protein
MKVFVLTVTADNYDDKFEILGVFSTEANAMLAALRSDFMRDIIVDITYGLEHKLLVEYAAGNIPEELDLQKQLYELLSNFNIDEETMGNKPNGWYFEINEMELDDLYY